MSLSFIEQIKHDFNESHFKYYSILLNFDNVWDFAAAKAQKIGQKITQKGGRVITCDPAKTYPCGAACRSQSKDCNNPIEGQAKNYAKFLELQGKKEGKIKGDGKKPQEQTDTKKPDLKVVDGGKGVEAKKIAQLPEPLQVFDTPIDSKAKGYRKVKGYRVADTETNEQIQKLLDANAEAGTGGYIKLPSGEVYRRSPIGALTIDGLIEAGKRSKNASLYSDPAKVVIISDRLGNGNKQFLVKLSKKPEKSSDTKPTEISREVRSKTEKTVERISKVSPDKSVSKPAKSKDGYERKEITLNLRGDKNRKIQAEVKGDVAIHKELNNNYEKGNGRKEFLDGYTVTHAATGASIHTFDSFKDAKTFSDSIQDLDLSLRDQEWLTNEQLKALGSRMKETIGSYESRKLLPSSKTKPNFSEFTWSQENIEYFKNFKTPCRTISSY